VGKSVALPCSRARPPDVAGENAPATGSKSSLPAYGAAAASLPATSARPEARSVTRAKPCAAPITSGWNVPLFGSKSSALASGLALP
jgi:hypothetical protein